MQEQYRTLSILEIELTQALNEFFKRLGKDIIESIKKSYSPDMMPTNLPLLVTPIINDYSQLYHRLIYVYNIKAYAIGLVNAEMIVDTYRGNISVKTERILTESITDDSNTLFKVSPDVKTKIKNNTYLSSSRTLGDISDDLNTTLLQGYNEGKGNRDIATDITKKIDNMSTSRAERIAVTEINSAQNQATIDQYQDLGVEYIEWSSARDNRVRPDHQERDGEIIPLGATFGNGLNYPGDRNHGSAKDWVWCRCTTLPFIMPIDKVAPSHTPFRETELIDNPFYEKPKSIEEALELRFKNGVSNSVESYDKYALNYDQLKIYNELKVKESPGFLDRKTLKDLEAQIRYNELRNKKLLGQKLTSSEKKEMKKAKKRIQDLVESLEFTPKRTEKYLINQAEKTELIKLRQKERLTITESQLFKELRDKKLFTRQWDKYTREDLSYTDTIQFVKYYNKYKQKWGIPNIDVKKLNIVPYEENIELLLNNNPQFENLNLSSKFKLTNAQEKEIYDLQVKRIFNEGKLLNADEKRLNGLLQQKKFNLLYSARTQNGGLQYTEEKEYKKLFKQLKTKLKLNNDLLIPPWKEYESKIKFSPVSDEKNLIKMEGITVGKLPGYEIDEIVTVDVTKLSKFERDLITDWTTHGYKAYRNYWVKANANKEKFIKLIKEESPQRPIKAIKKDIKEILYKTEVLQNILNNQLKEDVLLWRVQRELFDFEGKVEGQTVIMRGFNSTAFTKEGMNAFQETSHTEGYTILIEAGKGTKGAYVSPLAPVTDKKDYRKQMEFLLQKDTKVKILDIDTDKDIIRVRVVE